MIWRLLVARTSRFYVRIFFQFLQFYIIAVSWVCEWQRRVKIARLRENRHCHCQLYDFLSSALNGSILSGNHFYFCSRRAGTICAHRGRRKKKIKRYNARIRREPLWNAIKRHPSLLPSRIPARCDKKCCKTLQALYTIPILLDCGKSFAQQNVKMCPIKKWTLFSIKSCGAHMAKHTRSQWG